MPPVLCPVASGHSCSQVQHTWVWLGAEEEAPTIPLVQVLVPVWWRVPPDAH